MFKVITLQKLVLIFLIYWNFRCFYWFYLKQSKFHLLSYSSDVPYQHKLKSSQTVRVKRKEGVMPKVWLRQIINYRVRERKWDNFWRILTISFFSLPENHWYLLKVVLSRIQNWAWLVCSLFSFGENNQNVRSTVIPTRTISCQAIVFLEGLRDLQFSQQWPN